MRRRAPAFGRIIAVVAVAVAVVLTAVAVPSSASTGTEAEARAAAGGRSRPVTNWARREAVPLATGDPAAPLDDLAPLRAAVGDAAVVGLGESVHGAAEETMLKHRALRLLVEELGFRSIAWEDDWTAGIPVNDYIAGGPGDVGAVMSGLSSQWQTSEVADVLRWLRRFNAGRADKVQFFGVEYFLTGQLAYDALDAYVARVAPGRLAELRPHLAAIRPPTSDIFAYIQELSEVGDLTPYIEHARQVQALVESLPHRRGDREHAVARHHAHQIVSFYVHYSLPFEDGLVFRDRHAAEHVRWWRRLTGDRIAYWAASPHTANAPDLRIVAPPGPDLGFPSAGSHLRRWYGDRYRSIGFTFDHGTVLLEPGVTGELPPPEPTWFEHPLGGVDHARFVLDLRGHAPRPVRRWLHQPITTRGLPDSDPGGHMSGGTLAQWSTSSSTGRPSPQPNPSDRSRSMHAPPIVSPEEWEAARQQLLVKEKALTRARDALAAERRRMPWLTVEKDYAFEGPAGKVSLLDLFEAMGSTWSYLDITALGRQEEWEDSPEGYPQTPPCEWWIWHDDHTTESEASPA